MTEQTTHTPGPLRVDTYHGDSGATELYRLQAQVGITADGILRRGDADLYAAAPDLLAALHGLMRWCAGDVLNLPEVNAARAAIAKATGQKDRAPG